MTIFARGDQASLSVLSAARAQKPEFGEGVAYRPSAVLYTSVQGKGIWSHGGPHQCLLGLGSDPPLPILALYTLLPKVSQLRPGCPVPTVAAEMLRPPAYHPQNSAVPS